MKNLSLRSILLGFSIAVIVPLICFLILRGAGHDGHVAVPKNYGVDSVVEKMVDGKKQYDTIYHTVGKTNFLSHLNKPVDIATDYPGKTLIINFFTTGEDASSDRLTYHMSRIQSGFKLKKNDTSIQLLSVATDPSLDDLPAMRAYANKHTLDHDTWTFLMADSSEVNRVAMEELRLRDIDPSKDYKAQIVMLDKYHNIRGYYNGLDSMDIKRCIDDVALLMVEKNKIHEKSRR